MDSLDTEDHLARRSMQVQLTSEVGQGDRAACEAEQQQEQQRQQHEVELVPTRLFRVEEGEGEAGEPAPGSGSASSAATASVAAMMQQPASLDDLRTSLLQQPTMFSEDEVVGVDLMIAARRITWTSLTPLAQLIPLLPSIHRLICPLDFMRLCFPTLAQIWKSGAYENLFANVSCFLYYCRAPEELEKTSTQPSEVLVTVGLAVAARCMQTLGYLLRRPPTDSGLTAMKRWLFLKMAAVLGAEPDFTEKVRSSIDGVLEHHLRNAQVKYSLSAIGKAAQSMHRVKLWTMCALLMASIALPHFSLDETMKPFHVVAAITSGACSIVALGYLLATKLQARQIKLPASAEPSTTDLDDIHYWLGLCRTGYGEGLGLVLPKEERDVYTKCLKLCHLLDFPANPGFWDQLSRVGRLPDVFAPPLRVEDVSQQQSDLAGKDELMTEYVEAFQAGRMTPSLFGQQVVLGFPPLANLVPAHVTLVVGVLRAIMWVALAFAWVLLPSLARGNFASTEPPKEVLEMFVELTWAIVGTRLFYEIFLLGPNKFKHLCKRLVSAQRALNTSIKGPQIAAANCLPFVDVRSHRQLLAWSEARALLTNAATRELAALESELGMATMSLLALGFSLLGHVLMHKHYKPGVLTGATILATLACATELIPALFGGVILNSTLNEQVEVIRTKLYEVSMREAYEPRLSASGEDDISRARTYASNLLVALQSDQQAFRLFGIVLDVKTLTPVASGVYTGCLYLLSKVSEVTSKKQN